VPEFLIGFWLAHLFMLGIVIMLGKQRKTAGAMPLASIIVIQCFLSFSSALSEVTGGCYTPTCYVALYASHAPLEYAELVLSGELESYLKLVSGPYSGIGWDS
jgi:hypothetical protein